MANPNTNGLLTPALIAAKALSLFAATIPQNFARNFSNEPVLSNQVITVKLPSIGQAQDFDDVNGYVPGTGTLTDLQFTMGTIRHATFQITDKEFSSTNFDLLGTYSNSFLEALKQDYFSTVAALVTTGNYTNQTVQALTGISAKTIITANAALSTRNVPDAPRVGVVVPNVAAQLFSDPQVAYLTAGGLGITSAKLPAIGGVDFTQYSSLPNTNNLVGFIAHPDAFLVAARTPAQAAFEGLPINGKIDYVSEPTTGLTVCVREEYQIMKGRRLVSFSWVFGAGVGNQTALQRIVTA